MKKFTLSLRQLLGILVLSAALLSCKSKAAFDYSQNFVKKESTLTGAITETENKIGSFIRNEQYDSIVACADRMEAKVDAVMKEVKDEPAPSVKEGDNFKEAGIKYFAFIKSIYTGYKAYGAAKTPEDRDAELTKLQDISSKKMDAIKAIQDAQQKFADANGFKIAK